MPAKTIILILICWLPFLAACASNETKSRFGSEPDGAYDGSRADGAAWAAEGFTYSKSQPSRSGNDFEFYFKHCDQAGRAHYSKTAYECNEGP